MVDVRLTHPSRPVDDHCHGCNGKRVPTTDGLGCERCRAIYMGARTTTFLDDEPAINGRRKR